MSLEGAKAKCALPSSPRRIDGQTQGVGHALGEEHAEHAGAALDEKPPDAALLQFGDDGAGR